MTRKTNGKGSAAVSEPPPPTRVEISAGGHEVVVESTESLTTVAKKALELWRATESPDVARAGSAVGFIASEAPKTTLMPPELELPHRIANPEGQDPYEDHPRHR